MQGACQHGRLQICELQHKDMRSTASLLGRAFADTSLNSLTSIKCALVAYALHTVAAAYTLT